MRVYIQKSVLGDDSWKKTNIRDFESRKAAEVFLVGMGMRKVSEAEAYQYGPLEGSWTQDNPPKYCSTFFEIKPCRRKLNLSD